MTGIGFLGAGTIIQLRNNVLGLTTAAGIWAVAAVGMAMGTGLYVMAGATAVLILLLLRFLQTNRWFDNASTHLDRAPESGDEAQEQPASATTEDDERP